MTTIERACIAIIENLREQGDLMPHCGDPEWAQVDGAFRIEPVVRAVLLAIREPSEVMEEAALGDDLDIHWGYLGDGRPGGPKDVWQVMIDAALAEK